jgi:hypothetical protein
VPNNYLNNLTYSAFLSLDYGQFGTGSGFRLSYKNKIYLVTAKHVLFSDSGNQRCRELLVTSKDSKGNEFRSIIVNIEKAHILVSNVDDVVAIVIGSFDEDVPKFDDSVVVQQLGSNIISVDSSQTKNLDEINIGAAIYLVGCPTSLLPENESYFDVDRPLLRKGIVAGINSRDNKFIIDCSSYYGNSGAPIIELSDDGVYRVIGLVTRYIPFYTEWKNNREPKISHIEFANSGYSICLPMNAVFDLIDPGHREYLVLQKKSIKSSQ